MFPQDNHHLLQEFPELGFLFSSLYSAVEDTVVQCIVLTARVLRVLIQGANPKYSSSLGEHTYSKEFLEEQKLPGHPDL